MYEYQLNSEYFKNISKKCWYMKNNFYFCTPKQMVKKHLKFIKW